MADPIKTPDGRYLVIQGARGPRLWRASNPHLDAARRDYLVAKLMAARRALSVRDRTPSDEAEARRKVDEAKVALGERGPVWWDDGAPDLNRRLLANTPYRDWWMGLAADEARDDALHEPDDDPDRQ